MYRLRCAIGSSSRYPAPSSHPQVSSEAAGVMAEALCSVDEEIGTFDVPKYFGLGPRCPFMCHFLFASVPTGTFKSTATDWIGVFPCGWRSVHESLQRRRVFSDSSRTKRDPNLVQVQFFTPHDQEEADQWYQFVYVSSRGDVLAKSEAVNFGSDPFESPCTSQPPSHNSTATETGRELLQYPYAPLHENPLVTSRDLMEEDCLPGFDGLIDGIDRAQITLRTRVLGVRTFVEEQFKAQEDEISRLHDLLDKSEEEKQEMREKMDCFRVEVTRLQRALDAVRGYIPDEGNRNMTGGHYGSSFMSTGEYPTSIPAYDHSTDPLLHSHNSDGTLPDPHHPSTHMGESPPLMPAAMGTQLGHSEHGQLESSQTEFAEHDLKANEHWGAVPEDASSVSQKTVKDLRDDFLDSPTPGIPESSTLPIAQGDTQSSWEAVVHVETPVRRDSGRASFSGVAPVDDMLTGGSVTSHISKENLVTSVGHRIQSLPAAENEHETRTIRRTGTSSAKDEINVSTRQDNL